MRSNIFRYVANRANFTSEWLDSQIAFQPANASAAALAVRKFLQMDQDDYFVTGPTLAMLGTPALAQEFKINDLCPTSMRAFRRPNFEAPPNTLLVADLNGPPQVKRHVDSWPIDLNVQMLFVNSNAACFLSGGQSVTVPVNLSDNMLTVAWPSWTGIRGMLQLNDPAQWTSGFESIIEITPSNYPAEAVLRALQQSADWITLLNQFGLLTYYAAIPREFNERLGVIALGLALDTLANS